MQLSKEEYARKRIHNGFSVYIENSVTRVTVRHHSASLVMPNSYPSDGIFNQHLTTIKDSYSLLPYFICANSKGSCEAARMHRLVWAFADRLCDKYHNLMSWLIYFQVIFW